MPGGLLANDQFIEVKGTLASAGATTLTATIVANISDGDFIETRGFADSTGTGIITTRVRRKLADDIELQTS